MGPGRYGASLATAAILLAALPARAAEEPSLSPPEWIQVAPGIEFARVEARRHCRSGNPRVAVVRVDPRRCRFEPYHENEFPEAPRANLDTWRERLAAPVVFNAGLYDEHRRHLGVLRRDGHDLGGLPHRVWAGMLVSGAPANEPGGGGVLDLAEAEDRDRAPRYPSAVQSMMLLDRHGNTRTRETDDVAPRTLVAEDAEGRIVVIVTEGGYTLAGTAALLRESGWGVVEAMALDGGSQANLEVAAPAIHYRSAAGGGRGTASALVRRLTLLPAVIAVRPDTAAAP